MLHGGVQADVRHDPSREIGLPFFSTQVWIPKHSDVKDEDGIVWAHVGLQDLSPEIFVDLASLRSSFRLLPEFFAAPCAQIEILPLRTWRVM